MQGALQEARQNSTSKSKAGSRKSKTVPIEVDEKSPVAKKRRTEPLAEPPVKQQLEKVPANEDSDMHFSGDEMRS